MRFAGNGAGAVCVPASRRLRQASAPEGEVSERYERRQMMGRPSAILAVAGAVSILALPGFADAKEKQNFKANLTGAEEVPPVVTETSGKVKIHFNKDETEAEFELTVHDGVRVQQAHLHCAAAGVNGPVIIFLA